MLEYQQKFLKEQQQLERLKTRYKRQNQSNKEKYDYVSVALPKGTKERITSLGLSTNGLLKKLLLEELERLERSKK